jgi:hypothetical protein
MSATTTTNHPGELPAAGALAPRTLRERTAALVSSALAVLLGLAPHVLHHAGPLAGAALLAGTAGSLLFGAIGLLAAIPFLLRVYRRCDNWRVPGALLALFAVMFSITAFVIGPAISGQSSGSANPTTNQTTPQTPATDSHAAHHQ